VLISNNFGPVLSLQFCERVALGQTATQRVDQFVQFAFFNTGSPYKPT
jgi:hypothetical protein